MTGSVRTELRRALTDAGWAHVPGEVADWFIAPHGWPKVTVPYDSDVDGMIVIPTGNNLSSGWTVPTWVPDEILVATAFAVHAWVNEVNDQ